MTNVLFIHNFAEISGQERNLLDLWSSLDRRRFQPFLLAPREGALTCAARAMGVETQVLYMPSLRVWTFSAALAAKKELVSILKSRRIELIHSWAPRNHILAAIAGRSVGIPVIWHEQHLPFGAEWDKAATLIHLPDAVIANTQVVARRFQQWGKIPRKVHVVHNGVDINYFLPRDLVEAKAHWGWSGRPVVGLVSGHLSGQKSGASFLEMASEIASRARQVVFVIVGGEKSGRKQGRLGQLKELAVRLGITGQVVFAGFQEDVRPYLAAFDVYCSMAEHEVCPRALIEAMAMGKPCVAWRDGGNPEIIAEGKTGMLVETGDCAGFSSSVQQLLEDDKLKRSCSVRARTRAVERFDVRGNAAAVQDIYTKSLGKKGLK